MSRDLKPLTDADLPDTLAWTPAMVDRFFLGYLVCALWSTNDESNESGGEPLDANYSIGDIPVSVREKMRAECIEFLAACAPEDLDADADRAPSFREGQEYVGHDFWLTRNGHGTGFWDRDLPNGAGDRLSAAARAFGGVDLYVGDDGMVYAAGFET